MKLNTLSTKQSIPYWVCRLPPASFLSNIQKNITTPKRLVFRSIHPAKHQLPVTCSAQRNNTKFTDHLYTTTWTEATVIENKEASADGSVRSLILSVNDAIIYCPDGRKVRNVVENIRWIDEFKYPGQYIAVRFKDAQGPADRPFFLTSTPYEARSSSATLDAAIVELLVSRTSDNEDEAKLAALGPGAQLDVSEVYGQGFGSLFNPNVGLQSSMEEGRPIVMIVYGNGGIAPVRSALAWAPVLAHASAHSVTLYCVAESLSSVAYLVEWDAWRSAGVKVHPLFLSGGSVEEVGVESGSGSGIGELLEKALFHGEHGLVGAVGGDPEDVAVVFSGVPGDVAAHLTRKLTHAGVSSERLLVVDG